MGNRRSITHNRRWRKRHTNRRGNWRGKSSREISKRRRKGEQYRPRIANQDSTHTKPHNKRRQTRRQRQNSQEIHGRLHLATYSKTGRDAICGALALVQPAKRPSEASSTRRATTHPLIFETQANAKPEVLEKAWRKWRKWERKEQNLTKGPFMKSHLGINQIPTTKE